eukprot:TRINITY_DN6970_c0_g2_i2.p1 TRINITY_DN6970_c0_g2~~TRINITY_DN6970_c0_g2_i2.p1  ORF type:complete len:109 (-),score=26.55 TRINITY_DN6970_c0_g2_i2:141-467(-)
MSYETADSQKEEFRKYLEKNGIISQLTRVLVGLYEEPERPANAIDYIKKYLGAPTGVDVEELRADNDELKRHNAELESKAKGSIWEDQDQRSLCFKIRCREPCRAISR